MKQFEIVRNYAKECHSWTGPFLITDTGLLVKQDTKSMYNPTEWAIEQICKTAGCTPKFFQVINRIGECEIFNRVIGDRDFLFQCHRDKVRAVLSTRYDLSISNVWVIDEVVQRMNFTKILASDDVGMQLKHFTDDYMAININAGNDELLILNGETGRVALTFMIRVFLNNAPLTATVNRKIHVRSDLSLTEEILTKSVATVITKINTLKPEIGSTKFRLRKVDLRLLPYPAEIKETLFEAKRVKEEGVIELDLPSVIQRSGKIEDFRWNLIVSCDLFNVCTSLNKYFKEGWLVNWPIRRNWLK